MADDPRFETRAIHIGQGADETTGATIMPIYQTATFTQDAIGTNRGYEYSRSENPTRDALEAALASLEGGRFGLAYASGMAAIHGVMQLLSAGDHVVVCDDLYGGSYRLFTQVMSGFGVRFSFVDATVLDEIETAIGTMSHGAFEPDAKRGKGITEATVRLSVGIEHADDLRADLAQALERAASAR